jgi:hypothetical protein
MWHWSEVFQRYAMALRGSPILVVMGVVAVLGAYAALSRRADIGKIRPAVASAAIVAVCVLGGLVWSWNLRWISDDTFITLRYARNLIEGHGLVFNVGEKVEGYTNFLWLMVLAVAQMVGMDGPKASVYLSLVCFAVTIGLVYRIGQFRLQPKTPYAAVLPIACMALAANYFFASFGTGGLETMFAAMLVTLALERAQHQHPFMAGLAGIGATMAHPDHALFFAGLGLALLIDPERRRGWFRYGLPFLLVYLPYTIVRWKYFGEFFPNTYYAKAAHLSYFSQGGFYVFASVVSGGLWAIIPLAVFAAIKFKRNFLIHYALICVPLYIVYVAKIGGDYMLGRLICPILPIVFLLAEMAIRELLSCRQLVFGAAALLAVIPALLPTPVVRPGEVKWFLTDERTMYEVVSLSPLRLAGGTPTRVERLRSYLSSRDIKMSYAAFAIGLVGWETRWPIVDMHGLTDAVLARQPLPNRGRPGHERLATPQHVIERGADLAGMPVFPAPYADLTRLGLEGESYFFTHYNPAVVALHKGNPAVQLLDFPQYLDQYLDQMHLKDPAQIRKDLEFFDDFYFKHVADPARQKQLHDYIGS